MLKHIVLYKLTDASEKNIQKVLQTFMSMQGKIEVLQEIKCGRDVTHAGRSFDVALECVFESKDDLQTYIDHPVHQPVRAFVRSVVAKSVSVDYEF